MRNATGSESWCTVLKNEGSTAVAPANVFVSWALTVELDELITALNDYVAAQGLDPSSTYFWICNFSIRQNEGKESDVPRLGEMVRAVGHTVMYLDAWDSPQTLKRAWVIFELYHTADGGAKFEILMSQEQRNRFLKAVERDFGG